jgi:hypothetical protein
LLVLVLAGCASQSTDPTPTSLKPLPVVMVETTTTVPPAAVATTVPPVVQTAPLLDVYGNPIDDNVTYTVAPPAATAAPPRTAPAPTKPPTQPPTSQNPTCHRKNRKHCRP